MHGHGAWPDEERDAGQPTEPGLARAQFEPPAMHAIGAVGAMDLDIYRHQITHLGAA